MIKAIKKLNTGQAQAVKIKDGPVLVVAGAGTGKTMVLVDRLVNLVIKEKISSEQILLLTFTDKTQDEMTERVDIALPLGFVDTNIYTFHGFGEIILRESALDIGWQPDFKLLSATDQWVFIKEHLKEFNLSYYRPLGSPTKFISELVKHFSRLKDENILPEEYLKLVQTKKFEEELDKEKVLELAEAYKKYNELLREHNVLDFGDLIFGVLNLFKKRPNILATYRKQYRYIMVDEFQDTNYCQYQLLKLLAAPDNNLMVVGDDNQAIYNFRGASISNILQFKDDYPQAQEIVLNENYRSRQEILDLAYDFIQANNPNTLEAKLGISKKLSAQGEFNNDRPAIEYNFFSDRGVESSFTVNKIKELYSLNTETNWSDFAVLFRTNDGAEAFIRELKHQEVPYQFMSSRGLYYRPLILDILAYFKLLDNYHESSALFRVLSMEIFKINHADLILLNNYSRIKLVSLFKALQEAEKITGLSPEALVSATKLLDFITVQSELSKEARPTKLFLKFIYDSELLKGLDHDIDREKFSDLNQFYKKIKELESTKPDMRLKDLVERLDLEMESGDSGALSPNTDDADVVKLMTVHASKGLEFKYVFLTDLVDKKFPTIRRPDSIALEPWLVKKSLPAEGDYHLEEERRLFYVALTRAKEQLFLSGAKDRGGKMSKKPSRFLEETGLLKLEKETVVIDELQADLNAVDIPDIAKSPEHLPEVFSFSRLAAYASCPLQYKFSFVLKIPLPGDKSSLFFGKMMHEILQEFLEPLIRDEKACSKEELLDLYEEKFVRDGYDSPEERDRFYKEGLSILSSFHKNITGGTLPKVLFLEKDFLFNIGDYKLKGTIDRIDQLEDGSLDVIDYKTGNPKDKLALKDKKQLLLYHLFIEETQGKKVGRLTYNYLRDGSSLSFAAKEKELIKVREDVVKDIEAIRSGDFSPNPSEFNCKHCDFKQICEFRKI